MLRLLDALLRTNVPTLPDVTRRDRIEAATWRVQLRSDVDEGKP